MALATGFTFLFGLMGSLIAGVTGGTGDQR